MDRLSHGVANSTSGPSPNRASTFSLAASVKSLAAQSPVAELAWKHGMYARRVLIAAEDRKEYEALRDALVAEWRPRNVTAWVLVDHLAKLQWRLMRAGEAEAERLEKITGLRGVVLPIGSTASPEAAMAWDMGRPTPSLQRIQMFQMRLERSMHRAIAQLIALRKLRVKPGGLQRTRARGQSAEAVAGPTVAGRGEK